MQGLSILLLLLLLLSWAQLSESCQFVHTDDETATQLRKLLSDADVRVVEYTVRVDDYPQDFWTAVGGNRWFQPWNWYRVKGRHSQRLLLLFHYYYGILKPYLGIGARHLDLHLKVNITGCLDELSSLELETKLRNFLYYDLKNETERQQTKLTEDIRVCSQHVGNFSGWGRLVYHCCGWDGTASRESCEDVTDDSWVWILRAFIISLSVLLFLHFPRFIPKGYYVYSFIYKPPDGQSFNMLVTAKPAKYRLQASAGTILPSARWHKLQTFAGEVSKFPRDVVHKVKIKRVTFECGMDRLLSETSSPVSVFRSLFDSLIRCKVRHADSLEECCNAPVCGELCCTRCPPWHAWMRAVRTILLLLLLAIPALPMLYALAADNLEYQELAQMIEDGGLLQSYNVYIGSIFGKVLVTLLSGLYVLHMILVVLDGCHDQNLAKAYTDLLHATHQNARLRDRLRNSQWLIGKIVLPVKRFGVVAVPLCLVLLILLPVLLLVYLLVTSPVPKLLAHSIRVLLGKATSRHNKTKAEMSVWDLVESLLFVVSLVDVFAVLTLALNFLIHVIIIGLVQLIVNIFVFMKFFTIVILLIVYIRDAFRLVSNTYTTHLGIVLGYVRALEEEDIRTQANKDWRVQDNIIFKIEPVSEDDSKEEEEAYKKKKLFFIKNDALRMRTRSLVFFFDKDDISYIPKKFLEDTTTIMCPGSPGRLEEAYLRALGRFGRTVIFLMLIVLPLLAYAGTYEISNNLQFFAILFTSTIPLVMRYFFMSPGIMLKMDTSTERFRTQMDDVVKSFMQSWVVEDVEVELHNEPDEPNTRPLRPDTEGAQTAKLPPSSPSHSQAKRSYQPESGQTGHLNYLLPGPSIDVENNEDWLQYQNFGNADTTHPDDGTGQAYRPRPRPHKPHKKDKKKKKSAQNQLPLVDDLQAKAGKEGPLSDYAVISNGAHKERRGKESGKKKKEKVKIDLILVIGDDKVAASSRLNEEEKGMGIGTKPPSIHWNRRSRLVDGDKGRGEFDA